MDASAGSSPPHSQENPPMHGGGDRGEEPAEEICGEAAAGDDFMFADDTFPSLPDFPCLSSPSSSTYSSSSSTNSSSAYTNVASGGTGGGADGAAGEPASAGEGFGALEDIDQILDFASLSVPCWDSEPLFPDVGMMIEDAMSAPPHPVGDVPAGRGQGKAVLEGAGGEEGEACMDAPAAAAAGEELSRFFMEWLKSNRESISAEDLRGIRLRRSTVDAAAARLGGGRQGTMQLLKLILTWVKNNHLQKKSPRGAMEERSHGHGGQLPSPGAVNADGYEFPAAGGQDMGGTSWAAMRYQQSPAYGGENTVSYPSGQQQYTFHHQRSCGTSSVVVNSQPFSPPAAGDMHAASGGNISWPRQYVQFPAAGASTGAASYPMPRVVPQAFASGFAGQYAMGGGGGGAHQRMPGVEASATKEARKKRMAKQRRLSCLQQQQQQRSLGQIQGAVLQQAEPSPLAAHSAPVTPLSGGPWGFWPSSSGQQIRNPLCKSNSSTPMLQVPSPEAPPPAAKRAPSARQEESSQRAAASDKRQGCGKADKNLRFLLQKVLKQSDVGRLGRIVLPKKEAEIHLPELKTRDGISIPMEDIGTSRVWNMRYRFWPNNKSRMYLLENTGDFVRSNELQEGDFIVIYSDVKLGKYLIRGVKVRPAAAQEQANNGSGVLGKHKHGGHERAGASGGSGDCVDGTGKYDDGACKSRSPHAAVRRARQEAVSI